MEQELIKRRNVVGICTGYVLASSCFYWSSNIIPIFRVFAVVAVVSFFYMALYK